MGNPVWENLVDLIRGVYSIVTNLVAFAALMIPLFIVISLLIIFKFLPSIIIPGW